MQTKIEKEMSEISTNYLAALVRIARKNNLDENQFIKRVVVSVLMTVRDTDFKNKFVGIEDDGE